MRSPRRHPGEDGVRCARVTLSISPSFARHETFHPRVGWLSKAVQAVESDPAVFGRESAIVDLGVGKNMVRAIRFWAGASKLLDGRDGGRRELHTSPFGRYLLGEHGVDPYAEDASTLWLVHWALLRQPVAAATWWWMFNEVELVDFSQAQLVAAEVDWVLSRGWAKPPQTSLERDLDCLIRMYARRPGQADPIDSPFTALGLIEPAVGASKRWRFVSGAKESLQPSVILFASLMHMIDVTPDAQTIGVARLSTTRGGPGRTFRLTDSAIAASLRVAAEAFPEVAVLAPGGLTQLAVRGDKAKIAAAALASCHESPVEATGAPDPSEVVAWLASRRGSAL